jgi:hypothetical protein
MNIGLDAWIIQDGNYDEFESGRGYRFALEFFPEDLRPSGPAVPSLRAAVGAQHDALGTIMRATDSSWVVDFGVPAYREAKPPEWARVGLSVKGKVYIGVDPFFYFESLKNEPGMPDLFQRWRLRRILLETTPWITTADARGSKIISRANVPRTFREVLKTDAWRDDDGHAHYVLECELDR